MNGVPHLRSIKPVALTGAVFCITALVIAALIPRALAGWLVAFAFWSSLPIGSLCLVLMMRLIPGAWRQELEGAADAALLLLAVAFPAVLPILIAMPALYDWVNLIGQQGFRGLYLTPWFFILRTLIFFSVSGLLAILLLFRRAWSTPVAAAGLIVFVILDTMMAVDWLMSLDAEFHSSGFGLYFLSIQVTIALAFILLVRLSMAASTPDHTGVLGGLLLTALLFWAYFAFMQYFISWSEDLPAHVLWYQKRAEGVWSMAEYAIGVLGLGPAFLLLFPPVRRGHRWLMGLCLAVLAGRMLEIIWLVLPQMGVSAASLLLMVLAFFGLGLLTLAVFPSAQRTAQSSRRREVAS